MLAVVKAKAGWVGFSLIAMVLQLLVVLGNHAVAQDQRKGGPTPSPAGAEVYFVNLKDGATVTSKFFVIFGLDRMGVAPAGADRKDSGHHHLLIDTDLPPLDQPIPSDFNHLHFGAGQTEANVTLRPGDHTLQLLLADKDHIPHSPPVMSPRIKIHVVSEMLTSPSPPVATSPPPPVGQSLTPSRPGAEVYFFDLQDGATVQRRFRVRFGLKDMGIAPAGSDRENSGHHHLLIDADLPPLDQPVPNDFNHRHFGNGETETTLTLSPGEHTLQLLLADGNHVPHSPPVMSARIRVRVVENVATPTPGTTPTPGATSSPTTSPESAPAHDHAPVRVPAPGIDTAASPPPASAQPPSASVPTPGPPDVSPRTTSRTVDRKPSPRGAEAHFIGIENRDRIPSTVILRFGVDNMDIRPAGSPKRNSGHYHLLIDRKLPSLDKPIPEDSNHLDFPDGETRAKITLTPGEHTLQLLLGDDTHMPHDPPVMSEPLTVIVAEPRNRDDRNRRNRNRDDVSRRDSSSRGSSRSGSDRYDRGYGPDRYGPYRYRPYGYDSPGPFRFGRGLRF